MQKNRSNRGRIAAAVLAVAALVAVTAVATTELAGAADAARRAPRSTHIGVKPEDFVSLELVDIGASEQRFVRIHPDATRDAAEFEVPDGRVFVMTGYTAIGEWFYSYNTTVRFWVKNQDTGDRIVAFGAGMSREQRPEGTTSGALTEGVVFGSGTVVQVDALAIGNLIVYRNTFRPLDATNRNYLIQVRGYLADAD